MHNAKKDAIRSILDYIDEKVSGELTEDIIAQIKEKTDQIRTALTIK